MKLTLDISDTNIHHETARQLLQFAGNERVFLFDAPMGAGKTTFIKSLCKQLQVTDSMSSPTYSIVNEYHTQTELKIFHFDFYRLQISNELVDIGFDEYLTQNSYVFIEWPELALPFLDSYVIVNISIENNKRYIYAKIIS